MARLLAAIILMALILGVRAEEKAINKRVTFQLVDWNKFIDLICTNNVSPSLISFCNASKTTTTTSTSTISSTIPDHEGESEESSSTITSDPFRFPTSAGDNSDTTSVLASALERAHWCRVSNGSYLPLGYTFMHTECALCQCTLSRLIRCTTLQCMPTYCIDGSQPSRKEGQCCAQCAYEKTSTACVVHGVSFPHGTVLRKTGDNLQCWCELGNVECRKAIVSPFSGINRKTD